MEKLSIIEISSQSVKELRLKTGAGMMNCKKALQETNGDFNKAIESLRQKGLVSANEKMTRKTSEGLIEAYIHTGGKLGVLIELNCETDFVARRKEFQELSKNLAMQVAACSNVHYVSLQDIPSEIVEAEREKEAKKDFLEGKSEEKKQKIIEDNLQKSLKTLVLLEQGFIRDTSQSVDQILKQTISLLGENIVIARFTRFHLGG